jgi:hypothetical protein
MGMEIDRVNTIDKMDTVLLFDPFEIKKSRAKYHDKIKLHDFYTNVYPHYNVWKTWKEGELNKNM